MKLNLLKPLKRIFTALGGEETEDKNLVSVMDKIADIVEESGGSSDGNEPFIVTFSGSTENENAECDKTFSEIAEAYKSGKKIELYYQGVVEEENLKMVYSLNTLMGFINDELSAINGMLMIYSSPDNLFVTVAMENDNIIIQTNLI